MKKVFFLLVIVIILAGCARLEDLKVLKEKKEDKIIITTTTTIINRLANIDVTQFTIEAIGGAKLRIYNKGLKDEYVDITITCKDIDYFFLSNTTEKNVFLKKETLIAKQIELQNCKNAVYYDYNIKMVDKI